MILLPIDLCGGACR